jgi:NitT/TauT family transport system substrate-binding protein
MRSTRGLRLAAAVVAGGLLACGTSPRPAADPVRVAIWPVLSHAPLYIALDGGLFADRGLDVELVQMNTSDANAALLAGDVDVVANMLSAGVFNAIGRGGRLRLVADKGHHPAEGCAADGALLRSDLGDGDGSPDAAELAGLRVSLREGTVEEYFMDRLLARGGLTLDDVEITYLPPSVRIDGLLRDRVDLVYWSEPHITLAVDAGAARRYVGVGDVLPGTQWAFLVYGRSLLDERPGVGERFMAAYLEGVAASNRGRTPDNVRIVASHTGFPEAVVRRACWIPIRVDGEVATDSVLDFQRWAVARGYQDAVVPVAEFWEPRFVRSASRLLGRQAGH